MEDCAWKVSIPSVDWYISLPRSKYHSGQFRQGNQSQTRGKSCTCSQEPAKNQHAKFWPREALPRLMSLLKMEWRVQTKSGEHRTYRAFTWFSDWLESMERLLGRTRFFWGEAFRPKMQRVNQLKIHQTWNKRKCKCSVKPRPTPPGNILRQNQWLTMTYIQGVNPNLKCKSLNEFICCQSFDLCRIGHHCHIFRRRTQGAAIYILRLWGDIALELILRRSWTWYPSTLQSDMIQSCSKALPLLCSGEASAGFGEATSDLGRRSLKPCNLFKLLRHASMSTLPAKKLRNHFMLTACAGDCLQSKRFLLWPWSWLCWPWEGWRGMWNIWNLHSILGFWPHVVGIRGYRKTRRQSRIEPNGCKCRWHGNTFWDHTLASLNTFT